MHSTRWKWINSIKSTGYPTNCGVRRRNRFLLAPALQQHTTGKILFKTLVHSYYFSIYKCTRKRKKKKNTKVQRTKCGPGENCYIVSIVLELRAMRKSPNIKGLLLSDDRPTTGHLMRRDPFVSILIKKGTQKTRKRPRNTFVGRIQRDDWNGWMRIPPPRALVTARPSFLVKQQEKMNNILLRRKIEKVTVILVI